MLPLYKITINDNDETGVFSNALVDVPAHMKGMIRFNAESKVKYDFNEEKRMVTGVMISANTPIYRNADEDAPNHNVYFPAETIEKIVNKFIKSGFNDKINEMHDPEKVIEGVKMIHSYIIGGVNNPSAPEAFKGQNLQDGTWIATYHIENDTIWEKVKSGEFMGFSVEGLFDRKQVEIKKMKAVKGYFGTIAEVSKWDIDVDQDTFEIGEKLTTTWINHDETTQTSRLGDGEYTLEDGQRILVDSDGIIRNKFTKQSNMKNKKSWFQTIFGNQSAFAEVTAVDGTVLKYEGDLAEGVAVFIVADGAETPAPAGEYSFPSSDGKMTVFTIDDQGLVSGTPEEVDAEAPVDEEMSMANFKEFMLEFDKRTDDKIQELVAINAQQQVIIDALVGGKDSKFQQQIRKVQSEATTYKKLIPKT